MTEYLKAPQFVPAPPAAGQDVPLVEPAQYDLKPMGADTLVGKLLDRTAAKPPAFPVVDSGRSAKGDPASAGSVAVGGKLSAPVDASAAESSGPGRVLRRRRYWPHVAVAVVLTTLGIILYVAQPTETRLMHVKPGADSGLATVLAGSDVEFSVETDVRGKRPSNVVLHYSVDRGKSFSVSELTAGRTLSGPWRVTLRNVQQDMEYYVTGGSAKSLKYHLDVLPLPIVKSVRVDCRFPPYTEIAPRMGIEGGDVEAIEGTRVTVHALTNDRARKGTLELSNGDAIDMAVSTDDPHVLTAEFVVTKSDSYSIVVRTAEGQVNPSPVKHDVVAVPDRAPTVRIEKPEQAEITQSTSGKVGLVVTALDDFGIKKVVLHARAGLKVFPAIDLLEPKTPTRAFHGVSELDVAEHKIAPGEKVEYWVTVEDTREPIPNRYETPHRIIDVVEPPPDTITTKLGKMTLQRIPAGEFLMGSPAVDNDVLVNELPQHRVQITRPFYLGVTEVTQGQYRAVTGKSPSSFKGPDDLPVQGVSWLDAIEFCNVLSEQGGFAPFYRLDGANVTVPDWSGGGYRLPTEAEWEYACRAGSTTKYSFGDDESRLGEYAWYDKNSGSRMHVVGKKAPNAFGLYDMHGNVWEWCWDGYAGDYYRTSPGADPTGLSVGASVRVYRGGSWGSLPRYARSAYRDWYAPGYRNDFLGFRVARVRSSL